METPVITRRNSEKLDLKLQQTKRDKLKYTPEWNFDDVEPDGQFIERLKSSINFIPEVPIDHLDYIPQRESNTPEFYPQKPNYTLQQPEFFNKFDLSTLFYIFIYFPGSSQQYFAARELSRRQWNYHKSIQTWFRLIDKPEEANNEYIIGKFEYLDYSSSKRWCVRVRDHFKFILKNIENN